VGSAVSFTGYGKRNGMRTSPIGAKRRKAVQWEQEQATSLEGTKDTLGLFDLHKVDWLHCVTPRTDKGSLRAGFPDYFLLGRDWGAFLEIKARNKENGRIGKLSPEQIVFHERLRRSGFDVMHALLPDDYQAVNLWLREKTGIVVEVQL
jgi:hypothetical protein